MVSPFIPQLATFFKAVFTVAGLHVEAGLTQTGTLGRPAPAEHFDISEKKV